MEVIRLEFIEHRGDRCVAVRGQLTREADRVVRDFPGRKYSKTHGCWYIIYAAQRLVQLKEQLARCQPVEVAGEPVVMGGAGPPPLLLPEGYHEALVRVRYSEATVSTYESQMRKFLGWIHPRTVADLDDALINAYQLYLARERRVSISTQNTAINAIKFYLEKVHHGERKVYYVDRPMKEEKLPHVLTQEEMKALIGEARNMKHRCILLVLYSTGVRMSELLHLRWGDFDESKKQVFVRGGKGRKDRLTITSKKALDYIKRYMDVYKPKEYLFEGPDGGRYSPRSVNHIIRRFASAAGISKRVSAHTIRHSFATHLLENHTDIRYIQMLMGHESSKTTERYTHMTTKGFVSIKSPLDNLDVDLGADENPNQKRE